MKHSFSTGGLIQCYVYVTQGEQKNKLGLYFFVKLLEKPFDVYYLRLKRAHLFIYIIAKLLAICKICKIFDV